MQRWRLINPQAPHRIRSENDSHCAIGPNPTIVRDLQFCQLKFFKNMFMSKNYGKKLIIKKLTAAITMNNSSNFSLCIFIECCQSVINRSKVQWNLTLKFSTFWWSLGYDALWFHHWFCVIFRCKSSNNFNGCLEASISNTGLDPKNKTQRKIWHYAGIWSIASDKWPILW